MDEISDEAKAAIANMLGADDFGLTRFQAAQRRTRAGEEVCRQVAMRHGLAAMAVQAPQAGVKQRHHIVMARAHAAATLRDMGLSSQQVGSILHCNRSSARRMALRWDDHRAGRLESVSEDQARAVDRIIAERGVTQTEACAIVGVGVTRYQSRKIMMGQAHGEDR